MVPIVERMAKAMKREIASLSELSVSTTLPGNPAQLKRLQTGSSEDFLLNGSSAIELAKTFPF